MYVAQYGLFAAVDIMQYLVAQCMHELPANSLRSK